MSVTTTIGCKIVNLSVRPTVWANLSFEVGGIVGQSNVTLAQNIALGQSVTPFDFGSFYATLGVGVEQRRVFEPTPNPNPNPNPGAGDKLPGGGAAYDRPKGS